MAKKKRTSGGRFVKKAKRKAPKKRRTSANRKPRAVAATKRKSKPRKNMAKKKRSAPRRRSNGGGNMKFQDALMEIGGFSLGYVGAGFVAQQIPMENGTMKSGALAIGGAYMATKTKGFMRQVALGIGSRGAVAVAQQYAPGITGMGNLPPQLPELTEAQVYDLEQALLNGITGEDYGYGVMGEYDERNAVVQGVYDDRNGAIMGDEDGGDGDGDGE